MAIYIVAWFAAVSPLAGAGVSFFAETARRGAQVCRAFAVLGFLLTLVVLATRLKFPTQPPYDSFITYFSMSPPESGLFASRFEPLLGVHVDSTTAVFAAIVAFAVVGIQSYGAATLRGDPGYRRFCWTSCILMFAVVGLAYSPNLFQFWLLSGMLSAAAYILLLHWWDRADAGVHARRVFVTLIGADTALLLALLFVFVKFGIFSSVQPAQAGADIFDPFTFSGLPTLVGGALRGQAAGVGLRTLEVASILLLVVAMIRSLQVPFHVWLGDVVNLPGAVIAVVLSTTGMAGVYLLAREYPLLLAARHLLAAAAIIGAATAALGGALALAQRDLYRAGALISASMLGVALATLGAGGFASGLYALAIAMLLTAVFFAAAGNISRAYRTRDLDELGGSWRRMRASSVALGAWALAAGGLSLTTYYAVAAVLQNHLPNGGHLGGATRASALVLLVVAVVLISAAGLRVVLRVCLGEPARRRGFQLERVAEPVGPARRWASGALAALVVLIALSVPGVGLAHTARLQAFGANWNDLVVYGSGPAVAVSPPALGVSLAALIVGVALALGTFGAGPAPALATLRPPQWLRRASRDLYLEQAFHRAGMPFVLAGTWIARFDDAVGETLTAGFAESVSLASGLAASLRRARSAVYLAGSAVFAGLIVVLSLLAATGHLGGVSL